MHDVSNSDRSFGYGEISGEVGDFATPAARKAFFKSLIAKANSIPLIRILRFYNIKINATNCFIVCPFKSHKSGRESTGSFKYYENTNSFRCFGCNIGSPHSHACEFVAAMEDISSAKAAYKIINSFNKDVDFEAEYLEGDNLSEQLEIMMDFSNIVREFRKTYLDKNSQIFIEQRCEIYDNLNTKLNVKNEILRSLVDHLKEQIIFYTKYYLL